MVGYNFEPQPFCDISNNIISNIHPIFRLKVGNSKIVSSQNFDTLACLSNQSIMKTCRLKLYTPRKPKITSIKYSD